MHPLRMSARAIAARAGAASAVFMTLAVVLLTGSQIANASGGPPDEGDVHTTHPVSRPLPPEPVDPAGPPPPEPVEPPASDAPEPPDAAEPPPADEPDPTLPDDPTDPTGVAPPDDLTDPTGVAPSDQLPDPAGVADDDQLTGGGKIEDPADVGSDPAEPEPVGLPVVVTDPATGLTGQDGEPTSDEPLPQSQRTVGSGEGEIVDEGESGSDENSPRTILAQNSSAGQGGGGGTEVAPAGGSDPAVGVGGAGDEAPAEGGADAGAGGEGGSEDGGSTNESADDAPLVPEPVERLVRYVPDEVWVALAALGALSALLAFGYLFAALRARRLARQRRDLLQEVGLLQSALLPPVPDRVGALRTSVAYRPADGPGAGGDFYDVLPLPGGRVGFILGDVSGHGRGALARTAFMRYTLRAYLEAGLEPRVALQVAGRVIDDNLGGDFATVLLAVHDPETGSLTYATAGHPAPIVAGPQPHEPVTAGSSPPIGVGLRTGLRQTTVPLVPGSVAAMFTDGLMEARTEDGILGRERLAALLGDLGDEATARGLIESVAAESTRLSDDMAAVIVSPTSGVTSGLFRTEQLELSARELEGPTAARFLAACGLPPYEVEDAEHDARLLAERFGGVTLHVVFGNRLRVEVLPRNVESIEAASRRVSAGSAQ